MIQKNVITLTKMIQKFASLNVQVEAALAENPLGYSKNCKLSASKGGQKIAIRDGTHNQNQ